MESVDSGYTYYSLGLIVFYILYEGAKGAFKNGKKNSKDLQMLGIAVTWLMIIERPLLIFCTFSLCALLIPQHLGALAWLEEDHLVAATVVFVLIDELLHGWVHNFAHAPTPKNLLLAKLQRHYKVTHRTHHLHGGADNRGELGASQTIVVGWGWAFSLPNYWFGYICLYLGLIEAWAIGTAIKSLWGIHTHANLDYDLKLLNHKNPIVSKTMYSLAHIFVFPTQHHQHHSRSKNSGSNLQNFLAIYDWLLWKKLVICYERPKIYGWRKNENEENSSLYRYFYRRYKKV
ncbi:MAG: hypothetical protein ACI90U_002689 [Pseudomonadales bacterium]|jgi:hypothetical protein